jgi:histidyl-tRNA synthetase
LESVVLPKFLSEGKLVDAAFGKSDMGAQMKQASRVGAKFAVIVGEQEVNTGQVIVKDMESGEQTTSSQV